jgi:hypothetical protein
MRQRWIISVDMDGVLCEKGPPEKDPVKKPIQENIDKVNALYKRGCVIIIYTGRIWARYDPTKQWLIDKGVLHNELVMGKLVANFYCDDKNADLDQVLKEVCGKRG